MTPQCATSNSWAKPPPTCPKLFDETTWRFLWHMVITIRNQLIHGYGGIDDYVLRSIVHTDIPTLLISLHILKTQEPG